VARTAQRPETIHFRGAPRALSTVVKLDPRLSGDVRLSLELPRGSRVGDVFTARAAPVRGLGLTRLRLRVPKTMAPGTYRGSAEIGETRQPIVVEIQPERQLRFFPSRTSIEAEAGASVDLTLALANLGNVAVEVPESSAFGLFPVKGMDEVISRVIEARLERGERRIDRFLDELAESHGGNARVRIRRGSGRLEPGDVHDLELTLRLPAKLVSGRLYRGLLSLDYAKQRVEVRVLEKSKQKSARRRKQ